MVTDRQKVWMDRMDGRMHGQRKKSIPLTSSVDNNQVKSNGSFDFKKNSKKTLIQQFIKN